MSSDLPETMTCIEIAGFGELEAETGRTRVKGRPGQKKPPRERRPEFNREASNGRDD